MHFLNVEFYIVLVFITSLYFFFNETKKNELFYQTHNASENVIQY
jgi:hypothetical protein